MRTVLALLLSFVFSLNSAYASMAGVCDAVDHLPQSEAGQHLHMDHHSHDSSGSTPATEPQNDDDPLKASQSAAEHCHAHGASASVVFGGDMTPPPLCGGQVLVAFPSAALVSVTAARLERPPRVSLA